MHVVYHGLQWSGDTIGDVFFVRIQAIQDTAKKCQAFNHFSDGGNAMFFSPQFWYENGAHYMSPRVTDWSPIVFQIIWKPGNFITVSIPFENFIVCFEWLQTTLHCLALFRYGLLFKH